MTQEEAVEEYKAIVKLDSELSAKKHAFESRLFAKAAELGVLPGYQWDYLGDGSVKPVDQCAKVLKAK